MHLSLKVYAPILRRTRGVLVVPPAFASMRPYSGGNGASVSLTIIASLRELLTLTGYQDGSRD